MIVEAVSTEVDELPSDCPSSGQNSPRPTSTTSTPDSTSRVTVVNGENNELTRGIR